MIEYATNENGNTELIPIPGQIAQNQDPTKVDWDNVVNIDCNNKVLNYTAEFDCFAYLFGGTSKTSNFFINNTWVMISQSNNNSLSFQTILHKGDVFRSSAALGNGTIIGCRLVIVPFVVQYN